MGVDHVFVGNALRILWRLGVHEVEVLRPEFDAHGYDLVMARDQVVRHIQFKTGTASRPMRMSLARVLAEKLSGCAIWMRLGPGSRWAVFLAGRCAGRAPPVDRPPPEHTPPDPEQEGRPAGSREPLRRAKLRF